MLSYFERNPDELASWRTLMTFMKSDNLHSCLRAMYRTKTKYVELPFGHITLHIDLAESPHIFWESHNDSASGPMTYEDFVDFFGRL